MPRPYPPISGVEGRNPARQYQWFRPRQAARGAVNFTSGVGSYCDVGLFNNSRDSRILVVRDWYMLCSPVGGGAGGWFMSTNFTTQAGSAFSENYMKSQGILPGLMVSNSDATLQFPNIWMTQLAAGQRNNWGNSYPFALIEPGWSLLFQTAAQQTSCTMMMVWEAIAVEELDYFLA